MMLPDMGFFLLPDLNRSFPCIGIHLIWYKGRELKQKKAVYTQKQFASGEADEL